MSTRTALHRDLGLSDDEYEAIVTRLGREPSYTELAMFSVMWSEHCSYKSSRLHLRRLPTTGPQVLVGPGEGAGVVALAPGVAVAWKIESHNHPSFVEPVNGAATGVGGIVRDVLSMGARPIALLDSLRFGPLEGAARNRYLLEGVVAGISSYGNSIGVPTVGGETSFDPCYEGNILVNVACLGVLEGPPMHARAERPGDVAVLIGAATGRDGIGGASVLASVSFAGGDDAKRPAVQVGDPFAEKLLIEACLELVRGGLLHGLQDLGAGGLTCPASEMTAGSGTGIAVDVDAVHRREPNMEPFEVMISESQERMLAIADEARVAEVLELCDRWGLPARVVGRITAQPRVVVHADDAIVADVPAPALADDAPLYDRPRRRPGWLDELAAAPCGDDPPAELAEAWLALLTSPEHACKRWIWEQYDHMIFLGTVQGPGADAAVIRLPGRDVAAVLSTDGPGRYCYLDPRAGAIAAVAEAARNVACTGARPLAVTNCLNLGSPEDEEVMWQFAEVVDGIAQACTALGTPVTGGNVSFYNATGDRAIHPTPVIGMLGVLDDARHAVGAAFSAPGDAIAVLGDTRAGDFGGSDFAATIHGTLAGRPPEVDLAAEARLASLLHRLAAQRVLTCAHDCSGGGLAVALAECALRSGLGFSVDLAAATAVAEPHRAAFSETPGRVVATCAQDALPDLLRAARAAGVPARAAGVVGGPVMDIGAARLELGAVRDAWEAALPSLLSDTVS